MVNIPVYIPTKDKGSLIPKRPSPANNPLLFTKASGWLVVKEGSGVVIVPHVCSMIQIFLSISLVDNYMQRYTNISRPQWMVSVEVYTKQSPESC